MRLLLDTHVLLWSLSSPRRLPALWRDRLADPANDVLVSAASIWEVAIKQGLGKQGFDVHPDDVLRGSRASGFVELPITGEHAARVLALEAVHRDPFDRLLIAQALCEPAYLLTADATLTRYAAPIELITAI